MDVLDKMSVEEYNKKYPRSCSTVIIGASKQSAFDITPYGLTLQIRAELKIDKENEVVEKPKAPRKSALDDMLKKLGCVRLVSQSKGESNKGEVKKYK